MTPEKSLNKPTKSLNMLNTEESSPKSVVSNIQPTCDKIVSSSEKLLGMIPGLSKSQQKKALKKAKEKKNKVEKLENPKTKLDFSIQIQIWRIPIGRVKLWLVDTSKTLR